MHLPGLILGMILLITQLVRASVLDEHKEDFHKLRQSIKEQGNGKFKELADQMRTRYDRLPNEKKAQLEKRDGIMSDIFKNYLDYKLANPLYRQAQMRTAFYMDQQVPLIKRKLTLMKRDGHQLTKREIDEHSKKVSQEIAEKVRKDMIFASKIASDKFQRDHKRKPRSKTPDGSMIQYGKRSLLDPNKGSSVVVAIVVGILLSLALFPLLGFTGLGVFAATTVYVLAVQPLVNKILLGHWFWGNKSPSGTPEVEKKNENEKQD